MASETRERIVETTAGLFRRQGYSATGIKQIVTAAGAPFGSIYHFFPGGKEELAETTIRRSGALYGLLLPAIFDPAPDLVTAVRDFYRLAGVHLAESDYADACPIATVALEVSSSSERLRQACADVFDAWIDAAAARLRDEGIGAADARRLALAMIAALEGAFVLSRALRSTEPLTAAGEAIVTAIERAIP